MTQSEKPHKEKHGNKNNAQITVYYDGACPKCIRDRQSYEKLSGQSGEDVCWFDITGRDNQLRELGMNLPRFSRHLSQTKTEQEIEQKTASQKSSTLHK